MSTLDDRPEADKRAQAQAALSHEFARHSRLMHAVKTHLGTWAPSGLDWAAFSVLFQLVKCGARRQGELAEMTMLDPSTISRYAAQLTRAGLIERRPDPDDGRAVQLGATQAGLAMHDTMIARRDELFRQTMINWTLEDVAALGALIARFNDDLEAFRPQLTRALAPHHGASHHAAQHHLTAPDDQEQH